MYTMINYNMKWIVAGLAAIWIVNIMASCSKETSISNDNMETSIIKSYTENGYVQKSIGIRGYTLWTMPSEPVKYNDEQEVK